jgi:cytochrome c5
MKSLKVTVLIAIAILVACVAPALNPKPEYRGKALFNDTKLGGGTAERSCSTCHPDGKGLEGIGSKKEWKTPAGDFKTLEETVNICIAMALKGTALDVKSEQMKDLVSYMRTIKPKEEKASKKKKPRKPIVGC